MQLDAIILGAGPAGLEATRALGQRGYEVMLAEASEQLGGRVLKESALPGLAEWRRVRDWRVGRIEPMPNVSVFRGNALSAQDVLDIGADAVVLATGAHWVRTGIGRSLTEAFSGHDLPGVFTPDDLMAGRVPETGPVVLYDDDNFYLASVLAEVLVLASSVLLARLDLSRLRLAPAPLMGALGLSVWVLVGISLGALAHDRLAPLLA